MYVIVDGSTSAVVFILLIIHFAGLKENVQFFIAPVDSVPFVDVWPMLSNLITANSY